jgi:deazaflavin-dependent oxidoreductase (nitroreductase family)
VSRPSVGAPRLATAETLGHRGHVPERRHRSQSEKTHVDRLMARFAQSRLGCLLFITVFPAIDKRVMPLTGGRVRIGMRQPVLLLHARGAKTGQPRVTPLLYTPRGEDFVLIASKAGAERQPAWYHNLTAHPRRRSGGRRRADLGERTRGRGRRARGALAPGQRQLLRLRRIPATRGCAPDPSHGPHPALTRPHAEATRCDARGRNHSARSTHAKGDR